MDILWTIADAAKELGVTERTVRRRLNKGVLRGVEKDGRRYIVPPGSDSVRTEDGQVSDRCPDTKRTKADTKMDTSSDSFVVDSLRQRIEEQKQEIKEWKAQTDAWRLQAEASNRALSEVTAALRKAIENNQKQLPASKTEKEEEEISVPPQEETFSPDSRPSEDEPAITDAVTAERQDEQADSAIKAEPQQLTTKEPVKSTFIGRILRRLSGKERQEK